MSQGENGSDEEALQLLTLTIDQKIGEGAKKIESFFSSASIYRVPEYLRKHKESAYTPCLIAIGPLHRNDKHLQTPLQNIKMSYTKYLLSRLTVRKFTVLQECLAELKTLVDDAKKCYAEEVTLDEEMMLVDGCFILELFYGNRTKTGPKPDPIFDTFSIIKVASDLVLLENQIPFIVLEKLFQLTVGRIPNRPAEDWSLTDYVRWFYGKLMRPLQNSNNSGSGKSRWFGCTTAQPEEEEGVQSGKNIDDHRTAKYNHILHNLHYGYLPRDQPEQIDFDFREMPSASELVYAGVKFVPDTVEICVGFIIYFIRFTEHIAFCVGFIIFIMAVLQFVHDFIKKSG